MILRACPGGANGFAMNLVQLLNKTLRLERVRFATNWFTNFTFCDESGPTSQQNHCFCLVADLIDQRFCEFQQCPSLRVMTRQILRAMTRRILRLRMAVTLSLQHQLERDCADLFSTSIVTAGATINSYVLPGQQMKKVPWRMLQQGNYI